jgi:DNA-binding CsgD family transcriptional regulator
MIDAIVEHAVASGDGMAIKIVQFARATLYNGLARYDEALVAAQAAGQDPPFWASHLSLHELVEAAARSGRPDLAARAVEQIAATTAPSGTDWALGIEARSRALLSTGDVADDLYREAVARLDRSPIRPEAARAHLLYGEWLRREHRRTDAREHLRIALEMFHRIGAAAFEERARLEIVASGEKARKRIVDTSSELTPRERQVARLAAASATNAEIAARLFLSTPTVDYHLRKVFRKLGITSRRELARALPEERSAGAIT